MDAVILEDIGEVCRIGEIVDGYHIKVAMHFGDPGDDASNTTETIDRNFWYSHYSLLGSACKASGRHRAAAPYDVSRAYQRSINAVRTHRDRIGNFIMWFLRHVPV